MPMPKDPQKREEWRRKQSESHKGQTPGNKGIPLTDEQRAKLSASLKGRIAPNKGKHASKETKARLSASHMGQKAWNKGVPMSEEQKTVQRATHLGKRHSDTTKTQISESQKARYANGYTTSEVARKKASITHKGKIVSAATREKQSAIQKGKPGRRTGIPHSPETIKRLSQISRQQWENMTEEQKVAKLELLRERTKDITKSMLEEVIAIELDAQGIEYERQKRVGWYRVDFYIPSQNCIIEAQGCFWHACEQCGEELHKEKRVTDAKRHEYLLRKGYILKVIWEHERKSELRQFRRGEGGGNGSG